MRLIVDGFGKFLSKRDNQIVVKESGDEVDFFLADELEQVIITGKGSVSFDAMQLLAEYNVDLVVLNWMGDIVYRLSPPERKNISARREQFHAYYDQRGGFLCKQFIFSKMNNQRSLLGTLARSRENKNPEISDSIWQCHEKLSFYSKRLMKIRENKIELIRDKIMGLEGQASVEYWQGFKEVVDPELGFVSRSGRNAIDGVNSLLNYGYGILRGQVWRSIHLSGLDPYAGFLHADRYGRASLVFDLMEEFRQQVVDKSVLKLLNKNKVNVSDFVVEDGLCKISNDLRRSLITQVMKRLESEIKIDGRSRSWYDIIDFQAKLMVNFLLKKDNYQGFYWRW
ncbi:MAG: CRISPR-associated endonuclease Cas1 [Methanomicrobiales archaeon]